jgi:GrpB-like predicted nucleotidyltransferase (UPF0157 family)
VTDSAHDSLGLVHGHVRLAEPTPRWEALFGAEAVQLAAALKRVGAVVEHCGSTSVPGLIAKPILDILVGVPEPIDLRAVAEGLAPLGYEHRPNAGVTGNEVFGKGNPRTHLLHVVPLGGATWLRMLRFRDMLRGDPALAGEYAELKRSLATRFPTDRAAYTAAKDGFISRLVGASDTPPEISTDG